MPIEVVNILIDKVDKLAESMAEVKTDVAWLKKICADLPTTSRDVTWLTKGLYIVGGALASWGIEHFIK